MPRRSILLASFTAITLLGSATASIGATVSGPVRRGDKPNAFHASVDDLKSRGYIEEEFFIEGTTEGKSTPESASSILPYKTRLLVRRPADPRTFNGTVVVEWQNVTLGFDFEVGWPMFSDLMMREGYAWVGATVQPIGVNFLRTWDSARYGPLAHPGIPAVLPRPAGESGFVVIPGETFSYGIFTEIGTTLRRPGSVDPLGGLKVQRVLAYGLSQSAGRLTTYINNLPAKDRTYDGYYLHVGPGRVRDDLDVPVFGLNSENEMPRYYQIRRPDSAFYRYWEVPGSGHVPRLASDILTTQTQRDGAGWAAACDFGPAVVSIEYASRAVLHHLNEWVKTGKQPPHAPFTDFDPGRAAANGEAPQPTIRRDTFLNATGGVRLPHIEVPTGRHIGTGTPTACRLIPGYAPFDAATLASLYPTHESYVSKVKSAAAQAVKAGFLLLSDAKAIEAEAAASAAKELKVSGLKQSVEVYRDGYGTPHVFAQNNDDLFVAFGYLTAEDRLFQLDYSRRAMSGRIAEIRGPEFLESDRYFRTLGLRPLAEAVAAKSDPATRQVLERFSQGINAYIASHGASLPVEFQRLGYAPEPWTPADSILIWKMFGNVLDLSKWRSQVARARLVEKFGDRAKELFPGPDLSATIVQPGEMRVSRTQTTARLGGFLQDESTEGSNDWVVAAKKSVTGKPILAADPHLQVSAPAVWYEVHLKGGDYDVAGIAMAGTPFVFMGHNARIAFAYTYSTINVTDVYEERLNPANSGQYEYLGRWEPIGTRREVINVKGRSPVTLDVRSTRHGPLVSEFTQAAGKHYAVRWSDFEVQANEMQALRLINLAANWDDFRAGVRHYNTLSGNFLYGDVDGNIGYHTGSAVPIRRKGDGSMAVPGWTDEYEWNGYVPFDELPHIYNPERGWIATANNTIAGSWYPYFLSNPGNTRAERIHEVLQSKERLGIEDFKALQSDVRSTQPRRVLPLLLAAFEGRQASPEVAGALTRVKDWKDAEFDRKGTAPTIYDAFYRRLSENVFLDEAGGDRELYRTLFGNASFTSLMFEQPNSLWFDNVATPARETRDDVLVRSFEQGVAELTKQFGVNQDEWRWERRNLVPMPHMTVLGTQFGALFSDFSLGPFAKPGRSGWTVDPSGGNQYRMIVDLSNLDHSISALAPGISGDPSSAHYKDQLRFWTDGTYHPKVFSREKAVASAQTRVLLKP